MLTKKDSKDIKKAEKKIINDIQKAKRKIVKEIEDYPIIVGKVALVQLLCCMVVYEEKTEREFISAMRKCYKHALGEFEKNGSSI